MKIERAWLGKQGALEEWKEIDEDRANRELANAHGDNAVKKLKEKGELQTQYAHYKIGE